MRQFAIIAASIFAGAAFSAPIVQISSGPDWTASEVAPAPLRPAEVSWGTPVGAAPANQMGTPVGSVPAVVQQASGNQGGNPALIGRQFQPVQPIPGAATPGNTPTTGAPAVVNAAVNDTRPDPWDNVVQLLSSQTGSNGAGAGAATAGAAPMAAMGAAPGAAPGVATGFQPIQVAGIDADAARNQTLQQLQQTYIPTTIPGAAGAIPGAISGAPAAPQQQGFVQPGQAPAPGALGMN